MYLPKEFNATEERMKGLHMDIVTKMPAALRKEI